MLQVPIVHGRGFSAEEAASEAPVTVVSAAGAKALWPGEDPIGRTLRVNIEPPGTRTAVADTVMSLRKLPDDSDAGPGIRVLTVVGVAADVVRFNLPGKDPAHLLPTVRTIPGSGAARVSSRRRRCAQAALQHVSCTCRRSTSSRSSGIMAFNVPAARAS
jgi:hypothetical protein